VDYPEFVQVPGSNDEIVLTDYMDSAADRGNLARVRPDGTEVWRVRPPTTSQDSWTVVRVDGTTVSASTWPGWDVVVDIATGQEVSRAFTK
jgi:hypothetical protein